MKSQIKRDTLSIFDYPVECFSEELNCIENLKKHDEYTYLHCLNVCRLSVDLGRRLKMSNDMIINLGWAALLHDMGKIDVPSEILNKVKQFTAEELKIMHSHPKAALRSFVQKKIQSLDDIKRLSAAFEHHQRFDLQGYPPVRGKLRIHPFSRIVSIADAFDAMTSDRIYHRRLLPDIALKVMAQGFGTIFDPFVLQAFMTSMGAFPVGSLVRLSDESIAVVYHYDSNADVDRPAVWIIQPKPEENRNLMHPAWKHLKILRSEFPEDYGVSIPKILDRIRSVQGEE